MLTMSKHKWTLANARCSVAFSWSVVRLGSDRHGTWLGSRPSSSAAATVSCCSAGLVLVR